MRFCLIPDGHGTQLQKALKTPLSNETSTISPNHGAILSKISLKRNLSFANTTHFNRPSSLVKQAAKSALIAQLDLTDAYRHILHFPNNWGLLSSTWSTHVNDETTTGYLANMPLSFGACSVQTRILHRA